MKKTWAIAFGFIVLMVATVAFATPVPDTGQTKCYDVAGNVITCPSPGQALYGQDANYSINPMSYTKLDSTGNVLPDSAASWTMVKDNVTGLVWEMKTSKDGKKDYSNPHDADNTYTWYDSNPATNGGKAGTPGNGTDTEDFIKALNDAHYGGYSDWRMPTIKELAYIVNYSILYQGPTITNDYFPNTAASWYWSSTTYAYNTNVAWHMNFYFGYVDNYYYYKDDVTYARAVRGGQSGTFGDLVIESFDSWGGASIDNANAAGSYTDNGDGTVSDTSTGLMWQQAGSSSSMRWEDALAYCEGLNLGGYTDWRLPTIKELRSLVDYSRYNPAIDSTYFPNTASWYWSSTTSAYNTSNAWIINFYTGNDNHLITKINHHDARAVRGGQYLSSGNLVISPQSRAVPKDAGSTSFGVSNTGTGTMMWTAAVISGGEWLAITSGNSGTNTGTITCGYTANTGTTSRTATIRVTASGASGSPADVTVTQAANTTQCTATIDGNLSMHIPLLSHLVPWWGAPSYTVDLVYAYNPSYPTMIIFKLTQAALAQSGVYLCDPSTLADDFTIHILDVLMPDGITRMWLDLTYSQALSANGVCFYVSNYGVVSK